MIKILSRKIFNDFYFNLTNFIKNNHVIIIAFFCCSFLAFYNLGKIEFWGEDEGQTLLYASRFLGGILTGTKDNITAFYYNSTLSSVILLQVPFIMIFGVRELAARMPNAIVVILNLFLVYKIGKLFLNKKALNILVIIYAVSGAVGLFKSALGVGFYIFFILLSFYKMEKFLFSPALEDRYKMSDLIIAIICLVFALVTVPDAYFYVPYFLILVFMNIKKIGFKKLLISIIFPVFIFIGFFYYQFYYPKKFLGFNTGTYEHFLSRKTGLVFSFNIKEYLTGYITNFSIFFLILFIAALIIFLILRIKRKIFFPKLILHMILLFGLHFFLWMFFVKNECGHLMHNYLIYMLFTAYCIGALWDVIADYNSKIKKENNSIKYYSSFNGKEKASILNKKVLLPILGFFFAFIIGLNFYHTFILFNNLSINKEKYPLFYKPYKIPCGYAEGRKLGMKSAAYILRKRLKPNQNLVSDKGVAFNFLYMGNGFTSFSSKNAIDLLKDGHDVLKEYNIRFIGISADYSQRIYNKIIIKHKEKDLYYIYDLEAKGSKAEEILRDQYDKDYHKEYINIYKAIPYYVRK